MSLIAAIKAEGGNAAAEQSAFDDWFDAHDSWAFTADKLHTSVSTIAGRVAIIFQLSFLTRAIPPFPPGSSTS